MKEDMFGGNIKKQVDKSINNLEELEMDIDKNVEKKKSKMEF